MPRSPTRQLWHPADVWITRAWEAPREILGPVWNSKRRHGCNISDYHRHYPNTDRNGNERQRRLTQCWIVTDKKAKAATCAPGSQTDAQGTGSPKVSSGWIRGRIAPAIRIAHCRTAMLEASIVNTTINLATYQVHRGTGQRQTPPPIPLVIKAGHDSPPRGRCTTAS